MHGWVASGYTFYIWKINSIQYNTSSFFTWKCEWCVRVYYIIKYDIIYIILQIPYIYNIYTYIMIYFITNSKLLCVIKESNVRAIKKKKLKITKTVFVIILFIFNFIIAACNPQWSFETYWSVHSDVVYILSNVKRKWNHLYKYICFLKYYIVINIMSNVTTAMTPSLITFL